MSELPTGTVTFLVTDMEGSTRLLTRLGKRFDKVIDRHGRTLREAIAAGDGVGVHTEGDSFFAVFNGHDLDESPMLNVVNGSGEEGLT